jgi:hypothetical protein
VVAIDLASYGQKLKVWDKYFAFSPALVCRIHTFEGTTSQYHSKLEPFPSIVTLHSVVLCHQIRQAVHAQCRGVSVALVLDQGPILKLHDDAVKLSG